MTAMANPPESRLRVLADGDTTFAAMLAAIDGARATITLEVYSFHLDRTGRAFILALSSAAKRGVEVRVQVDAWGTDAADDVAAALRNGGCQAAVYNPLATGFLGRLQRDHRKLMVVDGEVGFLGGINISDEFAGPNGWADLALELRGLAAHALARQLLRRKETATLGDLRLVLSTAGARAVRRRYLKVIANARTRLLMAHAYFMPDSRMLRAIRTASRRGVEVRLLLPGKSDVPMSRALGRLHYPSLIRAGVRIHEWTPSVLHAKAVVADGEVALLGSFNLDPWSLVNLEVLAEIRRADIAAEIERWIEAHLTRGEEVKIVESGLWGGTLENAGRRFLRGAWSTGRVLSRWTRGRPR